MDQVLPLLFEQHPEPMWLFDPADQRILAVNDGALRKYGYARQEFLCLKVEDIRVVEEDDSQSASLAAILQGVGSDREVARHRRKDGSVLTVEIRRSDVVYGGSPARLVVARDITRLVRLEAERADLIAQERESRARAEAAARHFQALFESAPGKFLVLAPSDFRIVAVSDAYLAATMTRRDAIQGRMVFEVFPDDPSEPDSTGAANLRRSLEQVRRSAVADVMGVQRYPIPRPGNAGFEERFWSAVNTPVPGVDGAVQFIIHRVEDVTEFVRGSEDPKAALRTLEDRASHLELDILLRSRELKQANLRLQHRDALLRNAQRLVHMGTWELHLGSGALTFSESACDILGVQPSAMGTTLADFLGFVHPEDRDRLSDAMAATMGAHGALEMRHRLIRPDGGHRVVRQAAEVVASDEGVLLAGVLQDVTAESAAATEAAAAFDLLRMAGRVARLGGWRFDRATQRLFWTPETCAIHEAPEGTTPSVDEGLAYYHPDDRPRIREAFLRCLKSGSAFDEVARIRTMRGNALWVRAIGEPDHDAGGTIQGARGAFQDISELVAAREESERLLRRLRDTLESMSDAFLVLDRQLHFRFVNSEAERILQRPHDTLLGRHIWTEFPEAAAALREPYEQALDLGRASQLQFHYAPLDCWLDVKAYPTRDGLAVYFRDVSDERRTRDELLLLQSAIARQNDILVITEASPIDEPEGPRIVYVNDAFVRRTGYSRSEVIGRTPRILQGPATDRHELRRIREALLRWEPVRVELLNYTRAGEPFWLELDIAPMADASGRYTHWVAVERDVSSRKDAEQRARINEERFQLLARATNDVIWDWDLASDSIWWNEAFETAFGYRRDGVDPDSRSWTGRIHPSDLERVLAGIHAVIDGSGNHWVDEYRFLHATGEVLEVIDRGFVIRNEAGKAVRMIGSMVDITERRRLEAQLRQAQRLDAVGQLTGGIAHDFNNLLTVILGNAELLSESLGPGSGLGALAETTLHAAVRGAELTNRLLAFARKQALHPSPTDVGELLQGMRELLRRTLGEQFEIHWVRGAGLWPALVDAGQLESAILNLCLNARDAMPGGGVITVETANVSRGSAGFAMPAELDAGDYVLIRVGDTGSGMDERTLAHAFEPFFTTKEVGKGSGLGLSMVYGFAMQSRGHVTIESVAGRGTQVRLYLPRSASAPTAEEGAPEDRPWHNGRETILVVEDDDLVRKHVCSLLEALGYSVHSVSRPKDALDALKLAPYQLLFTDVVMPGGMNGWQLAEQARRLRPSIAVIFTSGYADEAFGGGSGPEVQVQLLRKPYRRDELAAKIRMVLDSDGAVAAGP